MSTNEHYIAQWAQLAAEEMVFLHALRKEDAKWREGVIESLEQALRPQANTSVPLASAARWLPPSPMPMHVEGESLHTPLRDPQGPGRSPAPCRRAEEEPVGRKARKTNRVFQYVVGNDSAAMEECAVTGHAYATATKTRLSPKSRNSEGPSRLYAFTPLRRAKAAWDFTTIRDECLRVGHPTEEHQQIAAREVVKPRCEVEAARSKPSLRVSHSGKELRAIIRRIRRGDRTS
eukprot:TRINITY_DN69397_c0_g1_i1.p1 TRINITY_DN69397_c0_g1~~TRINITY_DN69397_c0_g1_i1.p1  ORF type:complete len:233 (+),score=28.54 TRINITY_DN69397_c0_g1_i1:33-731(+)